MKNIMMRSILILGASLMLTTAASAQDEPKVKTSDKENKYKSEDLKIKEKKEETKIKGKVKPMEATSSERIEKRTGETEVTPLGTHTESTVEIKTAPAPVVAEKKQEVQVTKKTTYAAKKHYARKPVHRTAARKTNSGTKYIVKTKVIRDTVYVPSPPETIVSREYVHDTVLVTRVDTVVKMQTKNTYTGYRVPRGDFKKVKLKKNGDEVEMKKKLENGKIEKEKVK